MARGSKPKRVTATQVSLAVSHQKAFTSEVQMSDLSSKRLGQQ